MSFVFVVSKLQQIFRYPKENEKNLQTQWICKSKDVYIKQKQMNRYGALMIIPYLNRYHLLLFT
jgi:hypothetical protein